jgi:hypothetical protein
VIGDQTPETVPWRTVIRQVGPIMAVIIPLFATVGFIICAVSP